METVFQEQVSCVGYPLVEAVHQFVVSGHVFTTAVHVMEELDNVHLRFNLLDEC